MGKLTIQEVSKILTVKNGLEPREASRFAAEMFSVILQRLQEGDTVKVKGLGTFKIINVEARESVSVRTGERVVIDSHAKVTFTPDTLMRELVNKPFSQFETVVLNDGVEFDDIQEEGTEEEVIATEDAVVEEPMAVEEQAIVEEAPAVEEASAIEDTPAFEEVPTVEEVPVAEETSAVEEPVAEEVPEETEAPGELINFYEDEEPKHHWGRWLLGCLIVLALLAGAAYGGYEYGRQQQTMLVPDTIVVKDTVYMAELQDSVDVEGPEDAIMNETETPSEIQQEPKVEVPAKNESSTEQLDQWAAKDERVRLGAYRIVGLSHEVTVLEGQTFYSICRAHLGPDMQCYVEVFNDLPRNPQIKVGQKLKIPKLELKKRRK